MQKLINNAVEKHRRLILDTERFIWKHPETGFKEFVTSKYMEDTFESLGYELERAGDIPGFCTVIDTGRPGPEVLILAELDSVICPSHPAANPETGAVHSCGHNAQCAGLVGVAAALREPGVLDGLSGKIRLCAVPAEELLEIEYRSELRKKGTIKYFGGKSEFLSRGYFDSSDIAILMHTSTKDHFSAAKGSLGCIVKNIIYKGKAAHAGGAPQNGRNALYAATCGLNAINAIRETFTEANYIRVHPIITHGGDMVNAIPETVRLESFVRGRSFKAIRSANLRVNRALTGAALSIGANVEIIDYPGYAPFDNSAEMIEVGREAAELATPNVKYRSTTSIATGSTDMGDLSRVMPVFQPKVGGGRGTSHGNDYEIVDPILACVESAKWQVGIITLLLKDGGARARAVVESYKPEFASKEEFLAYIDSLNDSGDRIAYREDGTAEVRFS
ncbi:MAG: amidohydrolase [Clostridia bacterium]|nr:amidohydrolase [Clostridia bacterium]MBR4034498.1 amidohydrolase [Clostridia bacterium]